MDSVVKFCNISMFAIKTLSYTRYSHILPTMKPRRRDASILVRNHAVVSTLAGSLGHNCPYC